MLEFRKMTIADKPLVDSYLTGCERRNCESSFNTMFMWGRRLNLEIAECEGILFIAFIKDGKIYFYPPLGDYKRAVTLAHEHSKSVGKKLCFVTVSEKLAQDICAAFPKISPKFNRDNSDYVYLAENLRELAGKRYHGKRGHVTKFEKTYNFEFKVIDETDFADCLALNAEWCRRNGSCETESTKNEHCAVKFCFENYKELGFVGGIIRVMGEPVAFTVGSRLYPGADTVDVHFEKALSSFDGAYPTINKYFVNSLPKDITFINREDDMGLEGLRKAKLSYKPEFLVAKYRLKCKICDDQN